MDVGVILDFETTGVNAEQDRIIEVGLIEFVVSDKKPPRIVQMLSEIEDPKCEISKEISEITGIDQEMVTGRSIDWSKVRSILERASLIIAHNAEFDLAFLKNRPELKGLDTHWACSMRHIDWAKHGFKSQKLTYLAADHGFLNPFPHRALFDCATTFKLISPYMSEMVENSYQKFFVVKAVNSPFESKDILKARRYQWSPQERCWYKVVLESKLEEERQFLAEQVYQGTSRHVEEERPSLG